MICRLTGRIAEVNESTIILQVDPLSYEIFVPAASLPDLHRLIGEELTLSTLQYLEGNPAGSHFIPRLIGFLHQSDREFFNEFVKVKGISMRRALRAMAIPVHQLAAAIEQGDERLLTSLPEIGKKTATQIIAELRGKLGRFVVAAAALTPVREMTDAQRVALEILVQWGDKRADAQRWIAAAVEAGPNLTKAEDIVRAAYRVKHGAGT